MEVQAGRKLDHNDRLPEDFKIRTGGIVLLYNNRHREFPNKLHTRWMGPYKVQQIFDNGSLQLTDVRGNPLKSKANGSRVKIYNPEEILGDNFQSS